MIGSLLALVRLATAPFVSPRTALSIRLLLVGVTGAGLRLLLALLL